MDIVIWFLGFEKNLTTKNFDRMNFSFKRLVEALKLTSNLPKETLINMDIVIWFLDFEKKLITKNFDRMNFSFKNSWRS